MKKLIEGLKVFEQSGDILEDFVSFMDASGIYFCDEEGNRMNPEGVLEQYDAVKGVGEKKVNEEYDQDSIISITQSAFEDTFGRPPKDDDEWQEWVHAVNKALDSHIDWDIVYGAAKEYMEEPRG